MKIANGIAALLFLFSAIVQYNDPDPLGWMAIYGAAVVACIWAIRGGLPAWFPALVGLAAAVWSTLWLPRVLGQVGFGEMFREAGMATMAIEEGREVIGLVLVAIWMLVLTILRGRHQKRLRQV